MTPTMPPGHPERIPTPGDHEPECPRCHQRVTATLGRFDMHHRRWNADICVGSLAEIRAEDLR